METIHLRCDADSLHQVLGDISSKLDDDVPRNARERILDLFDSNGELVFVDSDVGSAGTDEVIVRFKPSDRLLMLQAALRARDWDRIPVNL